MTRVSTSPYITSNKLQLNENKTQVKTKWFDLFAYDMVGGPSIHTLVYISVFTVMFLVCPSKTKVLCKHELIHCSKDSFGKICFHFNYQLKYKTCFTRKSNSMPELKCGQIFPIEMLRKGIYLFCHLVFAFKKKVFTTFFMSLLLISYIYVTLNLYVC